MPRRGRRIRLATGIFRDKAGISVMVPVGTGRPEEDRYALGSDLNELKEWRGEEIRKRKQRAKHNDLPIGSFAADARTYLESVTALPRYDQRCKRDRRVGRVVRAHPTQSDQAASDPGRSADRWSTVGPKRVQKAGGGRGRSYVEVNEPLAPSTVNKRLRALEIRGRSSTARKRTPVREVPECDEGSAPPRGLPYAGIEDILSTMPRCQTTARLGVIAYVVLGQSEMARLKPEYVNLVARAVFVPGRRKARGAKSRTMPLDDHGVRAFQEFISEVLAATGDIKATKDIAGHASMKTTEHYTEATANPRTQAAVQQFQRRLEEPRAEWKRQREESITESESVGSGGR